MSIVLDTHTHTIVSGHAYNTMKEMADMAKKIGLKALCITEHGPTTPDCTTNFYYFANLKVIPRNIYGIRLFLGVEANIINGNGELDVPKNALAQLDIVIASIHPKTYKDEQEKEAVTSVYLKAMENSNVHIIGHPDDGRYPVDYEKLILKAKETGSIIEINNSSLSPNTFRENVYENQRKMLELCKKYNIIISLGSDAHIDVDVANFEYALKLLEEIGFPEELVVNTSVKRLEESIRKKREDNF